ncbi:hypothetical protein K0M31_010687 [Melipona bicolor]|uniref:Uncharacterized protein n=1 Tax=Melipona bicolor TaxID=60889 RepID=A0AA40KI25_9HYME|nr:hypothetical protein K0M31_010687 [Melipona bicolor]
MYSRVRSEDLVPLSASSRQHPGSGDSTRRGRGSALRSTLARMCCAVLCCAGVCTIYNAIRASDGSARIYGSWRILPSGAREREKERNEKKKGEGGEGGGEEEER